MRTQISRFIRLQWKKTVDLIRSVVRDAEDYWDRHDPYILRERYERRFRGSHVDPSLEGVDLSDGEAVIDRVRSIYGLERHGKDNRLIWYVFLGVGIVGLAVSAVTEGPPWVLILFGFVTVIGAAGAVPVIRSAGRAAVTRASGVVHRMISWLDDRANDPVRRQQKVTRNLVKAHRNLVNCGAEATMVPCLVKRPVGGDSDDVPTYCGCIEILNAPIRVVDVDEHNHQVMHVPDQRLEAISSHLLVRKENGHIAWQDYEPFEEPEDYFEDRLNVPFDPRLSRRIASELTREPAIGSALKNE